MAVSTARLVPEYVRQERNPVVVMALRSLLSIASTLAASWDDLAPDARRRRVDELLEVVGGLSRLIEGRDPDADPGDWDPSFDGLNLLTARETQILLALESGASTTGISRSLGIGTATVRSHVKSILSKLGVHSRVEAIALAAHSLEGRRSGKNGS